MGWPRLLISLASPTKQGAPFPRVFCEEPALSLSKGRESGMPAATASDHLSATIDSTRSIAPPFGKLRAGSCTKRRDAAPSVGMMHARIVKVGHPPGNSCKRGFGS
jgi:hypothetical protein